MPLRERLQSIWQRFQGTLFPSLCNEIGPLSDKHAQFVQVLDLVEIERFVASSRIEVGRPLSDRCAIARAFIAKALFQLPTTVALLDRLQCDKMLRRLCGWERWDQIPSEATFSRAFAAFAASGLPERVHGTLIAEAFEGHIVGHVSRDATAIEAREKPASKPETPVPTQGEAATEIPPKRRRGRPRKDEIIPPKPPSAIELQADGMSLSQMRQALPSACDAGIKRNAKGHTTSWIGYKLHIDTVDGDIPASCILSSASVHDSQVCIPLALTTRQRLTNCYDLMDAAYDSDVLRKHSQSLGHVPIVDINPRRDAALKKELAAEVKRQALVGHETPQAIRYDHRSSAERVNSQLQDQYGGRTIRVRGAPKVFCHLMFGILTIAALQIMRLIQ